MVADYYTAGNIRQTNIVAGNLLSQKKKAFDTLVLVVPAVLESQTTTVRFNDVGLNVSES